MGSKITKSSFTESDYAEFSARLNTQLDVLKDIIDSPGFGDEPLHIGAELELYLVDDNRIVTPAARELLEALDSDQFTEEINQYNIELNLEACPVSDRPFTNILNEIHVKTSYLERVAAEKGIGVVPIGILPTLRQDHLLREYMTPELRYDLIGKKFLELRGQSFHININGEESVNMTCDDVTVEGANTSFQVHAMVPHKRFADVFNALQLTLPLVTALSANSSILLGNRVWDEARIALFKQSLDTRIEGDVAWQAPARVSFGQGWVRESAWELYAETVALFPPILPQTYEEDAAAVWAKGDLPKLEELALHMGTTWPWNRPVYSNKGNGHIRIELRAIPAGPTSVDMVANAAFALGLAAGLVDTINDLIAVIPYRYAEYNFYRAAQSGLDAKILWPLENIHQPTEVPIQDVIEALYPTAENGLRLIGIDEKEIDLLMGIIKNRMQSGITGARWQKYTHAHLEKLHGKTDASRMLVDMYLDGARSMRPVSEWDRPWE